MDILCVRSFTFHSTMVVLCISHTYYTESIQIYCFYKMYDFEREKNQFSSNSTEEKKASLYKRSHATNHRNDSEVFVYLFIFLISSLTSVNLLINAVWCKVTITSCTRYCNKSLII